MPISNTTVVRATAALLLAGLIALLAIVGTTIWLVERTQTYFNEVVEAREARTATTELRSALQDLEIGQRGYMLTLEEQYLEPYEAAMQRVLPALSRLEGALSQYPQAEQPLAALRVGIEQKLEEALTTIELTREGELEEAITLVKTDEGKEIMDSARELFSAIISAADERLNQGVIDQRNAANALRLVTILGALVILAVVGGSVWTVLNYTRELVSTRRELETTNIRLEERVADRTSELSRASEEVQRFAYIVTHDLRAPLVNIMGFTSELEASIAPIQSYLKSVEPTDDPNEKEARLAAEDDVPEALRFIRSSTRKMDGLINAILKISRDGRRPVRPEEIELSDLLEVVTSSIHHQVAEQGGEIEVEPDLPSLVSDRLALEQIFGNLLDNAVKYADPERPLRVHITANQAPGNRILIDVEDNGRGIAAEDHERVFELFRRSGAQSQAGEGIGLAHVRTLVRNLGGDITVESELGRGTTFRVALARDLSAIVRSNAA
ncbi:sensor histidine kinase [Devosia pacifica]|uniref:histidine kinase n=1 Tax=Devosia pacifica TaxID=1335967 RepID=A0A918RY73_9HYPH|nr:CHASE3 domain-containing protein [Devosia pacifica]GHA15904.1 sensor histidine kinase [Devosia pacifica]